MKGVIRAQWPITDPDMFTTLSIAAARRDLRRITDELQATLTGPPRFRTRAGWLLCEAPAVTRISVKEPS